MTPEELQALQTAMTAGITAAMTPLVERLATPASAAPAVSAQPERTYTRAELDAAVQAGTITAIQAQDLLDQQQAKQTARLVSQAVKEEVGALTREQVIDRELAEYQTLVPKVMEAGSQERAKVKAHYDYLVSIGQPATKATELVALNLAYGQLDGLKAVRARRRGEEPHEEVGGGEPGEHGDEDASGSATRPPKDLKLSRDERRYYDDLIAKGIYRDWAAVKAEMAHANSKVRDRVRH